MFREDGKGAFITASWRPSQGKITSLRHSLIRWWHDQLDILTTVWLMVTLATTMLLWILASKRTPLSHLSWVHSLTIACHLDHAIYLLWKVWLKTINFALMGGNPYLLLVFVVIWFGFTCLVFFNAFFKKSICHSSLREHSPTLYPTYTTHLVLYPNTLGTMCHFSLGVG